MGANSVGSETCKSDGFSFTLGLRQDWRQRLKCFVRREGIDELSVKANRLIKWSLKIVTSNVEI